MKPRIVERISATPEQDPVYSTPTPPKQASNCSAGQRIKVLIAEDHPVVRRGIKAMLSNHPRIEVSGEARDGQEALVGGGSKVVKKRRFEIPATRGA